MVNPITAIADFISGTATILFKELTLMVMKSNLWFIHALEIILFVLFFALIIAIIVIPGKVYEYSGKFINPIKRILKWVRG